MISRLFISSVAFLGCVACASHRAPLPIGDSSSPRLGWVIMHGSADNPDEEFACQSNPPGSCALPVSTAEHKVFSEVHLYFHPIGTAARYEGTVQFSFLSNDRPSPLNLPVGAKDVGNDSIVGMVTETPGEYALEVSAVASTKDGPVRLNERVPVTVK